MAIKRPKLTKKQRLKLLNTLLLDQQPEPQHDAAVEIVGVNKNTAQLFFHQLRELISKNQSPEGIYEKIYVTFFGCCTAN